MVVTQKRIGNTKTKKRAIQMLAEGFSREAVESHIFESYRRQGHSGKVSGDKAEWMLDQILIT